MTYARTSLFALLIASPAFGGGISGGGGVGALESNIELLGAKAFDSLPKLEVSSIAYSQLTRHLEVYPSAELQLDGEPLKLQLYQNRIIDEAATIEVIPVE